MAEVVLDAPELGFSEVDVTQGEDVPGAVLDIVRERRVPSDRTPADEEPPPGALDGVVRTVELERLGEGDQWVYAYGYACAPDRLKIGSATGDPVVRVAAQISTGTPDRPNMVLQIATPDCRALERALQSTFRLRGRQVDGAGSEWFRVTRDEIVALYRTIAG